MQLLFKVAEDAGAKPIVGNTDFKRFAPSAHRNMAWENMSVFVGDATRDYVIPHLGKAFYDVIASLYHSENAPNEKQSEAIELLKGAIAQYALYDSFGEMLVRSSDVGAINSRSTEGTAAPASPWSYHESRRNTIRKADRKLDLLLQFLDQEVKAANEDFATYRDSAAYQAEGSLFFPTTDVMDKYINIEGSRRAFVSIARYFRKAELRHLKPVLGQEFFDSLVAKVKAGTLTEAEEKLLPYIRQFMAEWGIFEAIPHISCVMTGNAIFVVSSTDSFTTKGNSNTIFGQAMIDRVQQKAETDARVAQQELINFLTDNKEDYQIYLDNRYDDEADTGILPYGQEDGGSIIL